MSFISRQDFEAEVATCIDDEIIIYLAPLMRNQTSDELQCGFTKHNNHIGCNSMDSPLFTRIYKYFTQNDRSRPITRWDMQKLRNKIIKYWKQF